MELEIGVPRTQFGDCRKADENPTETLWKPPGHTEGMTFWIESEGGNKSNRSATFFFSLLPLVWVFAALNKIYYRFLGRRGGERVGWISASNSEAERTVQRDNTTKGPGEPPN